MSEFLAIDDVSEEIDDVRKLFPVSEAQPLRESLHRTTFHREHLRALRRRRQERRRRTTTVEWTIRTVVLMCGLFIGAALTPPDATRATANQPLTRGAATTPSQPLARGAAPVVANALPAINGGERGTAGDVVAPAIDADVAPSTAPRSLRQPAGHRGTLIVTSTPDGAAVFMNQKYAGRTPLILQRVPAGSRAVRVDLDGYGSWSRGVSVVAEQSTTVSAKLIPTTVP